MIVPATGAIGHAALIQQGAPGGPAKRRDDQPRELVSAPAGLRASWSPRQPVSAPAGRLARERGGGGGGDGGGGGGGPPTRPPSAGCRSGGGPADAAARHTRGDTTTGWDRGARAPVDARPPPPQQSAPRGRPPAPPLRAGRPDAEPRAERRPSTKARPRPRSAPRHAAQWAFADLPRSRAPAPTRPCVRGEEGRAFKGRFYWRLVGKKRRDGVIW
jgi:hypothetical protein